MATRVSGWFDRLPAFWASFALTISSTLGPSVLSLPILFFSFGPVAAFAIILTAGLLNTLTLAFLAEGQLRALPRFRSLGFEQLNQHYLGRMASVILRSSVFIYCVMVLFVYTGGFLEAINDTVGGGAVLWFLALFCFVSWSHLPRNRANSLTLSLLIALTNLVILIGFAAAVSIASFTSAGGPVATMTGPPEIPWQIAIGAVLYSFAGHISISNGARLILHQNGAGKGFFNGAVSGLVTIALIYSVWVWISICAMNDGVLPTDTSFLAGVSQVFGPVAVVAGVVFVVLSLGIGASHYALAAFHVISDVTERHVGSKRVSLGQVAGFAGISVIMGSALVESLQGEFDLSRYFGLTGGLMAPIVAGVFPVLILQVCRSRGLSGARQVPRWMSNRFVAVLVAALFLSVYIWQANSTEFGVWYRYASLAVLLIILWLALNLIRRGVFQSGTVLQIVKSKDGWNPELWKIFENGQQVDTADIWWKTRATGEFELVEQGVSPARTLIAVRISKSDASKLNLDIHLKDNTTQREIDFELKDGESNFHELCIR